MSRLSACTRHFLRFYGICLAILALSGLNPAPTASAAAPVRLRLGVTADSITVVTPANLVAAGVDLAAADPRTFALRSLGSPVAILVTGEEDGRFDADDRLYFFGEKYRSNQQDEKYTDERVYWLDIGGEPGPRIGTVPAQASGELTPPADFATTLRAEENRLWWTLHTLYLDTQDSWFWARLTPAQPTSNPVSTGLSYVVPDPAPGAPAAFAMEVISRAGRVSVYPDHRTAATLNDAPLFDSTWDGIHVRKVFTAEVPANTLVHGANTVTATAWALTDADDVYINYWQLDYRRLFRAYNGQLDFVAEAGGDREYLVDGWAAADVVIWNVTDANAPVRLDAGPIVAPAAVQEDGAAAPSQEVSVRFRVANPAGARYWLQSQGAVRPPASIRLSTPANLRNPEGGADAVIVTAAEMLPAAERLAAWHRAEGRRALVVDIRDAYDEFTDGITLPAAIQKMLAWGVANWQEPAPAYLTLVGDGHWNFKGYNTAVYPNPPNPIPPYLSWVDPWQGEVPTDNRFGDIDDDGRPEIAVGRLAVNSLAEANVVVDKIVNYNQSTRTAEWQRTALFVSDNPDGSGNFPANADEMIAGYTPADLQIVRAYLPGQPPTVPATSEQIEATRQTILSTLASGAWMVQYNGHGAPERWTHESLWRSSDVKGLTNGDRLPIVMTFNCLDGYFTHPGESSYSLAELMQRQSGGGAIAAISPTGLGLTWDQQLFRKLLLETMFRDGVREMGAALLTAKQKFHDTYGRHYLIETMTLFGDPALRLPGQANQLFMPSVHTAGPIFAPAD